MNATMQKFGAPETCIQTFPSWTVLLRPAQVTLGAVVLIANEPATAFSQLSQTSFSELHCVTGKLEGALKKAFAYEKLNYLMLMMVDPDVHFHVIPRYSDKMRFDETDFWDHGWPGPPTLDRVNETDTVTNSHIKDYVRSFLS